MIAALKTSVYEVNVLNIHKPSLFIWERFNFFGEMVDSLSWPNLIFKFHINTFLVNMISPTKWEVGGCWTFPTAKKCKNVVEWWIVIHLSFISFQTKQFKSIKTVIDGWQWFAGEGRLMIKTQFVNCAMHTINSICIHVDGQILTCLK